MMNRTTLSLIVVLMLTLALVNTSYNIAWSKSNEDKDYCYDQVGDGHFCFNSKEKCRLVDKSDDIAESPCYNKDREY
jgi:hypothetical protein